MTLSKSSPSNFFILFMIVKINFHVMLPMSMSDYSLRIKVGNGEIEVHAKDPGTLAKIVNETTEKFFGQYSGLLKKELKF